MTRSLKISRLWDPEYIRQDPAIDTVDVFSYFLNQVSK